MSNPYQNPPPPPPPYVPPGGPYAPPAPVMPYGCPYSIQPYKPGSIMTLGVLGIIFASISLLTKTANLAAHFFLPAAWKVGWWDRIDSMISLVFAVVLMAASIGVVRSRDWGRRLLLNWAMGYLAFVVLDIFMGITVAIPWQLELRRQAGAPIPPGAEPIAYISMVVVLCMLAIYPIIVLVAFRKPDMEQWFQK